MAIRYAVDLTDTERTAGREMISKNKAQRSTIVNASIVLKADRVCGWTNAAIALASEVSTTKVEQLKKRFVEERFEAAVYRKPVTKVHRRKMTGDEAAQLIALFCRQAPAGHERWTLRMLADTLVEGDMVDSVSHETMRQTGKNMHVSRGKRKHGVFHPSKMPPVSATWRKPERFRKRRMILRVPKGVSM